MFRGESTRLRIEAGTLGEVRQCLGEAGQALLSRFEDGALLFGRLGR